MGGQRHDRIGASLRMLALMVMVPSVAFAGEGTHGLILAQAAANTSAGPGGGVAGTSGVPPAEPAGGPSQDAEQAGQVKVSDGETYDPAARRDPFAALIRKQGAGGERDKNIPPLLRVGLTEVTLIGVIWGGFGYTAMVQTPDGKGYTVRRGTKIGPNNGVVSKITESGLVVTERFTDIYGKVQEREYVKLLRTDEES